jgi:hypothetical protein
LFDKDKVKNTDDEKLTPQGRRFIKFWVLGVIVIFLLVSGNYLYGIKGEKELSRVLDRLSFILLLIIYITANIAIILAAR